MKNGWSSRRPDMTYESCCAKISVVVHSSSTRRRPSSPKALESPRVSKLTSSSSTCLAPLLHPEIFVFFQFHVRHVFVSSTRPLALCESSGHSPALFSHGLTQKLYEEAERKRSRKCPEQLDSDFRSENRDSDVESKSFIFTHGLRLIYSLV